MTITAEALARVTRIAAPAAEFWTPHLSNAARIFGIDTPAREAAFVAQCAHESQNFTRLIENLRYSSTDRLMRVWPRLLPNPASAAPYVNEPIKLANFVYAGVNGNGDQASGDGWNFRGRGLFQITGRGNYARVNTGIDLQLEIDIDLLRFPSLLEQPELAALSAGWWWREHDLNEYADAGAIDKVSGIINRGDPDKPAIGRVERAWLFAQGLENFAA